MSTVIWQYPLGEADRQVIDVPDPGRPIHVGHDIRGRPTIWFMAMDELPARPRTILIVYSGRAIPTEARRYIGTLEEATAVRHVFEGGIGSDG